MRTMEVNVTPELAREYLAHNTGNRPVDRSHVRRLADELRGGRWRRTHQGIAFDSQGVLKDGQHRLLAIIDTGIPAMLQVTTDVDPEAMDAIDQHRVRTAAQILAMKAGIVKEGARLTAMARTILQVVGGETRVSNVAASGFAAAHEAVLQKYLHIARTYAPAVAAAFAYADMLGWGEVESAASRFTEKLYTEGDPMRALDIRARTFPKEQGAAAGKKKFDIALNALLAVHEGREMSVARTAQPDYRTLERKATVAPTALLSQLPQPAQ
jgi:hypothetical protein